MIIGIVIYLVILAVCLMFNYAVHIDDDLYDDY
jgi:hypothetical protein